MVTGGGRGRVSGLAEQMWAKDTILDNNVKMGAECAAACTIFYREYSHTQIFLVHSTTAVNFRRRRSHPDLLS